MPPPIDLTGHIYGRLTVIAEATPFTYPRKWVCKCECGVVKTVIGGSLRSGLTRSCGCFNKEQVSTSARLHGEHGSRLYSIWHNMKQRCNNPKNTGYPYYGALGISVCPEWNNYTGFKDWAETSGYTESLSLDRINGTKNYCPENCRWETQTIQARNQKKRNTNSSGYTGVSYVPRLNKFQSYLTVSYKKVNLGMFLTAKEAYEARKAYIHSNNFNGFPK